MRSSYVVPMRWMVIYKYEVPGGALNLSSTKQPSPWSPWGYSSSRNNPHSRTGNQTRDLMISSQKLWPLDHEAGHLRKVRGICLWDRTSMCVLLYVSAKPSKFRKKISNRSQQNFVSEISHCLPFLNHMLLFTSAFDKDMYEVPISQAKWQWRL
jgi:hypothetical protein